MLYNEWFGIFRAWSSDTPLDRDNWPMVVSQTTYHGQRLYLRQPQFNNPYGFMFLFYADNEEWRSRPGARVLAREPAESIFPWMYEEWLTSHNTAALMLI